MHSYSLTRVSDLELTRGLASLATRDRVTTALLLAHIAEFDARRLYLPAAHPSMHAYCVRELKLSEDAAYKRITAARVARRYPGIFDAVAEGRISLSALGLLAPHLTSANAAHLLAASEGRTRQEVQELVASRFPRSESLELIETLPPMPSAQLAPGRVEVVSACGVRSDSSELASTRAEANPSDPARGQPAPVADGHRSRITSVASDRYRLTLMIGRATREKLEHARHLLGHQLAEADLGQIVDRALDALIQRLEHRKLATTTRPRRGPAPREATRRGAAPHPGSRHIPAHVKRAVWERDRAQCTFISEAGRRCGARAPLEFDHIEPFARGGRAGIANIRLRCRAHNQFSAEQAFGAEFMRRKREASSGKRRRSRAAVATCADSRPATAAASRAVAARERGTADELVSPLRILGFSVDEAWRAARDCQAIAGTPIEVRLRRALAYLRPRSVVVVPGASVSPAGAGP